jgi:4-hydroxybenzoyl-CoA thioesterase
MARVEIELPETFPFATELPIRVDDLNYGNHLGNDSVLTLAQEARVRLLARHGWSELDVAGAGLIQVDAAVVYRAEGKYGMVLRIEVAVADVKTRGCDFLFRLADAATGKEIARVKTGVVFYDYAARKVVHAPAAFREAFGGAEGEAAGRVDTASR